MSPRKYGIFYIYFMTYNDIIIIIIISSLKPYTGLLKNMILSSTIYACAFVINPSGMVQTTRFYDKNNNNDDNCNINCFPCAGNMFLN